MTRVTSKRIETKDLQGEGSFIVVKTVGWKTAKRINEFLIMGNVELRADMTNEQKKKHVDEETALTEQILFSSIVDWNWADENNNALPIPRTTDDLDLLTVEEVQFLLSSVTGKNGDLKNSESGSSTTSGLEAQTTLPQTSG